MTADPTHLDKIRERFTATADVFAKNVRITRAAEAERLAERATAGLADAKTLTAIDLACGPGTFTRPMAAPSAWTSHRRWSKKRAPKRRATPSRISNSLALMSTRFLLPMAPQASCPAATRFTT